MTDLPHHPAVTDLGEAGAAINAAEKRLDQARKAHQKAVKLESDAEGAVKAIHGQLDDLAAALADAPGETDVSASLEAIAKADDVLGQARQAVQAAREQLGEAERERAALTVSPGARVTERDFAE